MKLTGNKIFSFMLAAAFALTLAGCGGGGGGSAAAPDPDPTPMPSPQEMCEADGGRYNADGSCTSAADLEEEMALSGAQEAAMAAYMAAMAAVNGAKDPVAMGKAQMYAGMAKEASDAAAMATTSEMAMEYQMKAEMNRDMAMEAAGEPGLGLTAKANMITNQSAIDNAVLEGKTGDAVPKPASNAKRVGAALTASAADTAMVIDTPAVTEVVATATTPGVAAADAVPNGSVYQGQTAEDTAQALAASARAAYGASGPILSVTLPTTVTISGSAAADAVTRGETPDVADDARGLDGRRARRGLKRRGEQHDVRHRLHGRSADENGGELCASSRHASACYADRRRDFGSHRRYPDRRK